MKQFNLKSPLFSPIIALFLLFALQARTCLQKKETPLQEEIPSKIEGAEPASLHKAVGKGDLREVERYLEKINDDPEELQKKFLNSVIDGTTPLGKAIEQSDEPMVRGLSRHHCIDINETGKSIPSLLLALTSKKNKIAEILLNAAKLRNKALNVTASDPASGNTPLHFAAKEGYVEIVKLLLENEIDVNKKNNDWNAPLHLAVASGHVGVVRALLADKNIRVNHSNKQMNTPLHLAVAAGHLDVVEVLLGHKDIDVNVKNSNRDTSLHLAVASIHVGVVKRLVKVKNIDLYAINKDNMAPLRLAKQCGNLEVIEVFRGAQKNFDRSDFNTNGFSEESIKDCFAKGLDIDAKDRQEQTLLIHAVRGQYKSLVRFLIDQGADVNAQGAFDNISFKDTALHIAAREGHEEIAAMLLEPKNNIDVNIQNLNRDTPLHLAIYYKRLTIVKNLLEQQGKNVDLDLKNKDGDTALSLAKKQNNQNIIKMLQR